MSVDLAWGVPFGPHQSPIPNPQILWILIMGMKRVKMEDLKYKVRHEPNL